MEKGDKLRAYNQLIHLSKKANVHLFCLTDTSYTEADLNAIKKYTTSLHVYTLSKFKIAARLFFVLFNSKPYQVAYFHDRSIARKIQKEIIAIHPDHIYCQLIRTTEYAKKLYSFPKTLDFMDAFSMGMKRRINNEKGIKKVFIKAEANRLTAYENIIFDYFDHHTIISEQDRDLIYHKKRKEIAVIPNGVDENFLNYTKEHEKKYDLLFHGNLNYSPNIDCVTYIVQTILPLLLKKNPTIKLAISGANPAKKVEELCQKFPNNIVLLGFVHDVAATYKSAKIFLAPLQIGTGLQNKILEAMALKVPVVTSELCNNAIKGTQGIHLLTAKQPDSYVEAIARLLNDQELSNSLQQNAHEFVKSSFSWEKSTNDLLALMQ